MVHISSADMKWKGGDAGSGVPRLRRSASVCSVPGFAFLKVNTVPALPVFQPHHNKIVVMTFDKKHGRDDLSNVVLVGS